MQKSIELLIFHSIYHSIHVQPHENDPLPYEKWLPYFTFYSLWHVIYQHTDHVPATKEEVWHASVVFYMIGMVTNFSACWKLLSQFLANLYTLCPIYTPPCVTNFREISKVIAVICIPKIVQFSSHFSFYTTIQLEIFKGENFLGSAIKRFRE